MCGITGIIDVAAVPEQLQLSLDRIAHRGPDGSGIYNDGPLWMGHTRLAIQDLSARAAQPMSSADGRYVIVYNGECYNHKELRAGLEAKGMQFYTDSDTETLLNGYICYGPEMVQQINGIFAFAIYDQAAGTLFLARDHAGVKPLYYYIHAQRFLFASEIKAMLPFGIDRTLNPDAFYQTLLLQWHLEDHTGFKQVRKLMPGHCMTVSVHEPAVMNIQRWYQPEWNGVYKTGTEQECIHELDHLLQQVVQRQLLSDRPVGYFLSGGLDSSLIAAIAKKHYKDIPQSCFTIDAGPAFRQEGFAADLPYAQTVAKQLNTSLYVFQASPDLMQGFDDMIWHLDEAQGDIAPLLVQQIAAEARAHDIPVLLGGTGADDIFSGYRRHQALALESMISRIPVPLRTGLKHMLQRLPEHNYTRRWKKVARQLDHELSRRLSSYYFWTDPLIALHLFNEDARSRIRMEWTLGYFDRLNAALPDEPDLLNRMLYYEQQSFLPNHNLNYTDKAGMAAGVEIRVPYLDKELMDWSINLDPALKMKGGVTKYLLRKVAERYLPSSVIYRNKTGFGAPLRQWLKTDAAFRKMAEDRLFSGALQQLMDTAAIKRLWHHTTTGQYDGSYTLLSLMAVESWLRQFSGSSN